jgi:RNA polymerase sigma-70 factor (ECF subfamily)
MTGIVQYTLLVMEMTDEELVRRVQEGYVSDFEILLKRYERPLLSFLGRYLFDVRDAEDAAQEALVSVYRTIDRVDSSRKFSSYLFTVAKNAAVSKLRSRHPEKRLGEDDAVIDDLPLYEALADAEERLRVRMVMDTLDRRYSSVLDLYYFQELSYQEIARRLRIPVNTVRTWLSRAKGAFRTEYEKWA